MRSIFLVLISLVFITSCSKDNAASSTHKLKNCNVEYLYFKDEIRTYSIETVEFPMSVNPLRCSYTYAGENITRNVGNFIFVPSGGNLAKKMFSDQAYDSLINENGSVVTYTKYADGQGKIHEYSTNPITYFMNSQKGIEKITKKMYGNSNLYKYSYIHSGDSIQEMINDSIRGRIFYFSGSNLEKVVTDLYYQGKLTSKKEILFENYDQHPNPFKNLFYLPGAFYRAFSNNNYLGITINQCGYLADSTFGITSTYHYSAPVSYDSDGYPDFGDYY